MQAMNPNRGLVRILWSAVMFLASIGLAVATRRTIVLMKPGTMSSAKNPAVQLDAHFANHATLTLAHVLPAMLFMVLGPLQFVRGLRAKYPQVHRWSGRIFLTASAVVGVTGLTMAFGKTIGGIDEKAAITLFGTFFLIALAKALWHALRREFAQHREWMIGVEQAMEEMFAGFAANGEAARDVGAGSKTALHGVADGLIFLLHFFADLNARFIFRRGFLAGVRKVVVEDHGAFVHAQGKNEIGIHHAFVGVDHEVRINPEIERAALARGRDARFRLGARRKRAGLQTGALEILDGVLRVLDHAAQSFVRVGNVVAAVKIIVHVDFPVTVQRIDAAVEVFQFFLQLQRRDQLRNLSEEFQERDGASVQIDENKILPGVHLDRHESVFRAIEIADALELHHAFERAIVAVRPAVVRATKLLCGALRFGDHSGGMMPADIVKGAQLAVIAARDDDRLSGEVRGEEAAFVLHLIGAAHHLPGYRKHAALLESVDAGIEVPR